MPVTVVPTSSATVAIDTFMTDESRIITNCAAASVTRTAFAAAAAAPSGAAAVELLTVSPRVSPVEPYGCSSDRREYILGVEPQRRPPFVDRHPADERVER